MALSVLGPALESCLATGIAWPRELLGMIVFDLKCTKGHPFEGWFADSDNLTGQRKAGEVVCPVCGDTQVDKALMTPNVRTGKAPRPRPEAPATTEGPATSAGVPAAATKGDFEQAAKFLQAMKKLRGEVEKNCDSDDKFGWKFRT